jgi:hypothetical protein
MFYPSWGFNQNDTHISRTQYRWDNRCLFSISVFPCLRGSTLSPSFWFVCFISLSLYGFVSSLFTLPTYLSVSSVCLFCSVSLCLFFMSLFLCLYLCTPFPPCWSVSSRCLSMSLSLLCSLFPPISLSLPAFYFALSVCICSLCLSFSLYVYVLPFPLVGLSVWFNCLWGEGLFPLSLSLSLSLSLCLCMYTGHTCIHTYIAHIQTPGISVKCLSPCLYWIFRPPLSVSLGNQEWSKWSTQFFFYDVYRGEMRASENEQPQRAEFKCL